MTWDPIVKTDSSGIPPNLTDWQAERAAFSWDAARTLLTGLPGGGLNIAFEAVDRHLQNTRSGKTAILWLGRQGERLDLTYADLAQQTNRFANVLDQLGVAAGETVFSVMSRIPELYVAALGALKHQAVLCPLFSAFGPEPILQRMTIGNGAVLVTTPQLYARKVANIRDRLPALRHVLLAGMDAGEVPPAGTLNLATLLKDARSDYSLPQTRPDDLALLHFTSGTTGSPKGAMHVHEAVVAHAVTARYALDLRESDIFWCTADPGWVTGTSYGIIAPLVIGCTMIVDEAEFDAARWYAILGDERVTVWYTAPTAVRMLMKAGAGMAGSARLEALRFVASVGEPLNPECVSWGIEALGLPIHDNWWQTETGGIMIANFASVDIRPGSMGKPLPGIDIAVVERNDDGTVTVLEPGTEGELALRKGWPSMFRGYLHEEERYRRCFSGDWYLTGDLVRIDADGYVWFVGRADDVIKTAGHLVGPFEVESVLMEHPAVLEAGVIGKPDPVAGTVLKAFIVPKAGQEANEELVLDVLGFARKRLGPAIAPKEVTIIDSLPKTRSGKIMRRLLRARELGLPEGDLSMLEGQR